MTSRRNSHKREWVLNKQADTKRSRLHSSRFVTIQFHISVITTASCYRVLEERNDVQSRAEWSNANIHTQWGTQHAYVELTKKKSTKKKWWKWCLAASKCTSVSLFFCSEGVYSVRLDQSVNLPRIGLHQGRAPSSNKCLENRNIH